MPSEFTVFNIELSTSLRPQQTAESWEMAQGVCFLGLQGAYRGAISALRGAFSFCIALRRMLNFNFFLNFEIL